MSGGISAVGAISVVSAGIGLGEQINNIVSGPGGQTSPAGGGGGGSGGGFGSGSPFYRLSPYTSAGVRLSTSPELGGNEKAPNPQVIQPVKAGVAKVEGARSTPTQGAQDEVNNAKQDFSNVWADRLSRYLDYNTRGLG